MNDFTSSLQGVPETGSGEMKAVQLDFRLDCPWIVYLVLACSIAAAILLQETQCFGGDDEGWKSEIMCITASSIFSTTSCSRYD